MALSEELKDAMDRLDIRGSQKVDTLLDAIEDDEFGTEETDLDDEVSEE